MAGKGHPLPASGEARHDKIPEGLAREKGLGQDPAEITTPNPEGVNPDGGSYRYDVGPPPGDGADDRRPVERGEPEPGP